MAILLFLLRLIGWVLLAVLLLLLVALLIPLGVRFVYRPGSVRATACYGPLHFTLWPRKGQPEALKSPPPPHRPGRPCARRRTANRRPSPWRSGRTSPHRPSPGSPRRRGSPKRRSLLTVSPLKTPMLRAARKERSAVRHLGAHRRRYAAAVQ
ncbi:hypothetical protein NIA69_15555 [Gemmiger formicilis]|nr:hypothetical protein [Gemmiger formicilis]